MQQKLMTSMVENWRDAYVKYGKMHVFLKNKLSNYVDFFKDRLIGLIDLGIIQASQSWEHLVRAISNYYVYTLSP